jgi:hypothetical protein
LLPDRTTRVLGYTELWERMRRALAVEGDQTEHGWIECEQVPTYFSLDGQPDLLLGHVLAGLGIAPERVVAELLPYNGSGPDEIFGAAGFPLTAMAWSLAEGAWMYEIRGVLWSRCIGKLIDYGSDNRDWVPQDAVTLAEAEGTAGQLSPVDVTAIIATYPAAPPPEFADWPDFQIGYEVWRHAAEQAGEGTTWTISRSSFDLNTVPVDAYSGDPGVYAGILVDHRWYVIFRDGDTVRARRFEID